MDENMSPLATAMLERAKYCAQLFGHEMIRPVHLLAGYMMVEEPHRLLDVRMTNEAVFGSIMLMTPRGNSKARVGSLSLPLSLDREARDIVDIAEALALDANRRVEPRDLMAAMLEQEVSEAVSIIIAITKTPPPTLLENLLQQMV